MNENKAITYSLLAHIRNNGTLMKGPVDVFVPLIKRTLNQINNKGILKGESILEIQNEANQMYSIDFPIPVLKIILNQIANEVNIEGELNFTINKDNSFILKAFYFEDFEDKIQESKRDAENLEKIFIDFCKLKNIEVSNKTSIFDFIDKNKISISKYLSNHQVSNGLDYTIEAQFVEFFKKVPKVFDAVRRIYLGSIISSFLEYKTEDFKQDVELLFDTNFIISLIDLNTPESTHTCKKLIEVGKNLGFKLTILADTIEETKSLIKKKAENFTNTFLTRKINPEDLYNACERRNLSSSDLERIIDNLDDIVKSFDISIYSFTERLKKSAKDSLEYEKFKQIRGNHFSAIHDTIALLYVKEKRTKKIREFEKVNCWFVNNSSSHDSEDFKNFEKNNYEYQKETIRVDELLNILWLSNPRLNTNLENEDLIDIGLSSIVAHTLNDSLPKASIIRELDENIQKYRADVITDKDILNISSRISNRQIKNINEFNKLANTNSDEFQKKLKEESLIQEKEEKERIEKFDKLYERFEKEVNNLDKAKSNIKAKQFNLNEKEIQIENEKKQLAIDSDLNKDKIASLSKELEIEKKEKNDILNKLSAKNRDNFIAQEIKNWRRKSWNQLIFCTILIICGFIYLFYLSDWKIDNFEKTLNNYKSNIVITSLIALFGFVLNFFVLRNIRDKYYNHSNIKAFKELIEIPDELK
ncbi:hypothetical protein [Flavobacterium weaverense]|uniref:Uncharacterized protein n=1 Tax=Flavobacterium weaverense TaxID=271156 RepID=A0A3L9ZSA5_9FLAO|nr:hypothetical protein [Flavobacterium weaverense]RMA75180.1 hypothetical protein BC961_2540 [Flavobacterium weaverense]